MGFKNWFGKAKQESTASAKPEPAVEANAHNSRFQDKSRYTWKDGFVRVFDGHPKLKDTPDADGVWAGTAFFIDSRRLLTAAHVIDSCRGEIHLWGGVKSKSLIKQPLAIKRNSVETGFTGKQGESDLALIYLEQDYPADTLSLAEHMPTTNDILYLLGFNDSAITTLSEPQTNLISYHPGNHTYQLHSSIAKA